MKLLHMYGWVVVVLIVGVVPLKMDPTCVNHSPSSAMEVAYAGWPYKLDCNLAFDADVFYNNNMTLDYDDYNGQNQPVICEIYTIDDVIMYNITTDVETIASYSDAPGYLLPDLQINDIHQYHIRLTSSSANMCVSAQIHLNVTSFTDERCKQNNDVTLEMVSTYTNTHITYLCEVDEEVYPKIYINRSSSDVTFTWMRNCSWGLPISTTVGRFGDLDIPRVGHEDAGIYQCAVTYRNMTRYLTSMAVCVADNWSYTKPIFTCSQQEVYGIKGEGALFHCVANFGTGQMPEEYFNFAWIKQMTRRDLQAINVCQSSTGAQSNKRVLCYYQTPNQTCSLSASNRVERNETNVFVSVWLRFRNLQEEDYGVYIISMSANLNPVVKVNQTLTLHPEGGSHLASVAIIMVTLIVVLLLLFLVGILYRKTISRCLNRQESYNRLDDNHRLIEEESFRL